MKLVLATDELLEVRRTAESDSHVEDAITQTNNQQFEHEIKEADNG